jgi:AmmeMemoRadiSam system protein A
MEYKNKSPTEINLTDDEKKTLHNIALTAIKNRLENESPSVSQSITDTLNEKRGAFVSLHKHGQLRGCIGYVHGFKPLAKAINDMAIAAAFKDPRFPPLNENELEDLDIEISVLTPMKQISNINEIEVGKHGLMMIKGPYSGLLLPQVATQYNWDRQTFLSETCHKAGLPVDAWKDDETEIYTFSAEIF